VHSAIYLSLSAVVSGAIIGWCAVSLPLLYVRFFHKKEVLLKRLCSSVLEASDFEQGAVKKLQNDVFDAEIDALIDRKLDDLVSVFKRQIPMASTFLTGSLLVKLKASAKVEIVKMIPEIKEKLLLRIKHSFKPDRLLEALTDRLDFALIDRICFFYGLIGAAIGAGLGLLLGWVQLAIMPLFS